MTLSRALLLCCVLSPVAAHATDVEVHVHPVDRKGGVVRAQICTRAEFLKDCAYKASTPAHPGEVVVVVRDVPPGTYSAVAFHDVKNTGDVEQNALGMPKEGVGFSRDPMLMLGAPSFEDTSLPISGERVRVDIQLKFEP